MKNNIKLLGIRFSDNDFWRTFQGLLSILKYTITERSDESWEIVCNIDVNDKEFLCNTINESINGIYNLTNGFGCKNKLSPNYLKIKPENIYINDEVLYYITNNELDLNHEFFVIDFESNFKTEFEMY